MKINSLQVGHYDILNVFQEYIDGNWYDCAVAFYKQESSIYFLKDPVTIRIGALYNVASIGPKHCDHQGLTYGLLVIEELKMVPDINNPDNLRHCVVWDIINTESHEMIKDTHGELEMDFIIRQNQEQAELQNLADGLLFEELESGKYLAATLIGNQNQMDQEIQDQAF